MPGPRRDRSARAAVEDAPCGAAAGRFSNLSLAQALVGLLSVGLLVAGGVTVHLSVPALGAPGAVPDVGVPTAAPVAVTGAADGTQTSGTTAPDPGTSRRAAPSWVAATAAATGIPPRALSAYADATLAVQATSPGCRLGWTTLAAIGAVESGHGTHGGTRIGADGRPQAVILGPALDGSGGTAAIPATAQSTRWTGDPRWDHAVGPMQFLTSTWARWGVDADGDGVADPNDIDDAALSAGHYLCAAGGDLATGPGWWAAVRAYNHDDTYVARVLALADRYAGAR